MRCLNQLVCNAFLIQLSNPKQSNVFFSNTSLLSDNFKYSKNLEYLKYFELHICSLFYLCRKHIITYIFQKVYSFVKNLFTNKKYFENIVNLRKISFLCRRGRHGGTGLRAVDSKQYLAVNNFVCDLKRTEYSSARLIKITNYKLQITLNSYKFRQFLLRLYPSGCPGGKRRHMPIRQVQGCPLL